MLKGPDKLTFQYRQIDLHAVPMLIIIHNSVVLHVKFHIEINTIVYRAVSLFSMCLMYVIHLFLAAKACNSKPVY